MSSSPAGSGQPRIFNSIAELSDFLDAGQAARLSLPVAHAVRVVDLPDRPALKRRKPTVVATEAQSPWWLNAEYDAVLVNPQRVETARAPARQKPWVSLAGLIDWKLVSVAGTAAAVAVFVMAGAFWAVSSQSQAATETVALAATPLAVPAETARPAVKEPAAVAVPAAKEGLADIDKSYEKVIAEFQASIEAAEKYEKALALLKKEKEPAATCAVCEEQKKRGSYGTAVEFVSNPIEAAEMALSNKKMLLVLTISGNFEEAKFT
jgi:hypothetical protein